MQASDIASWGGCWGWSRIRDGRVAAGRIPAHPPAAGSRIRGAAAARLRARGDGGGGRAG